MSFLEELEKSKTLKVKFKGKFYPVPPPIFRQAKKFALESVGVDYLVFKNNPTTEKAKEKQIKKAFETFLESYLESIVPNTKSNPTTPKAVMAFKTMSHLTDPKRADGMINKWFPDKTEVEKENLANAFKGAIMMITHVYMEGNAGVPKDKLGHKKDSGSDDQEEIRANILLRATVAAILLNLVNKMYAMDSKAVKNAILAEHPKDTLEEFFKSDREYGDFFVEIKTRADHVLSKIDLAHIARIGHSL